MDATVLIATYNRAALLDETLASLARMRVSPALRWEAIVIDNNSHDDTRAVVERHIAAFPVSLRYLFEAAQGRSSALNAAWQRRSPAKFFNQSGHRIGCHFVWLLSKPTVESNIGIKTALEDFTLIP